ncbi:hypothetical protein K8942_00945 [Candidatus Peribacteria bacterium]|nr:MAG: hypothetical protein K8942_00945 [Candidatus Peribacteria bacterium]
MTIDEAALEDGRDVALLEREVVLERDVVLEREEFADEELVAQGHTGTCLEPVPWPLQASLKLRVA